MIFIEQKELLLGPQRVISTVIIRLDDLCSPKARIKLILQNRRRKRSSRVQSTKSRNGHEGQGYVRQACCSTHLTSRPTCSLGLGPISRSVTCRGRFIYLYVKIVLLLYK